MKNEPINRQDFESFKKELFENFALKQDLDDQKNELLDKLVDKETYKKDLARLATKDMLQWESHEIRKDLNDFKEEINQKLDKLLSAVDGLAKQFTNSKVEKAASEATFQRHEQWLEDHDARIEWLERKTT